VEDAHGESAERILGAVDVGHVPVMSPRGRVATAAQVEYAVSDGRRGLIGAALGLRRCAEWPLVHSRIRGQGFALAEHV
jgi:hypothetical protein